MLEEVMAIASFSEAAMENVFQHTMKFDKRWVKYLADEELSEELRAVQVCGAFVVQSISQNICQNIPNFIPKFASSL